MTFKTVTPPVLPPVTTAEAKAHCRVSSSTDDTWIASAVLAASGLMEKHLRRALINQTIDLYMDRFPGADDRDEWSRDVGGVIELRRCPISSVSSVNYTPDGSAELTLSAAAYVTDVVGEPGRIVPARGTSWPTDTLRPINGVRVRYVAGYGATAADVPDPIRQGIKIQVAEWYENRGDDPSMAAGSFGGQTLGMAAQLAADGFKLHRL